MLLVQFSLYYTWMDAIKAQHSLPCSVNNFSSDYQVSCEMLNSFELQPFPVSCIPSLVACKQCIPGMLLVP